MSHTELDFTYIRAECIRLVNKQARGPLDSDEVTWLVQTIIALLKNAEQAQP